MILIINIFNIYYLFLFKRYTSHLTNFIDFGSIIPETIIIILIKILYLKWFRYLYYLIKKLSLFLKISEIIIYLRLVLELILIKFSQPFKRVVDVL